MQRLAHRLLLVLYFAGGLFFPAAVQAQEVSDAALGTWTAENLRAVIHVERNEKDALTAFLTDKQFLSNPEAARRMHFSDVGVRGDSLFLEASRIGIGFRGAISADSSSIKGTWTQGERSATITLTPADEVSSAPSRPQHPEPPFPYATEEVTFQNADEGVALAGTLSRPEGEGPFPGVLLLQGSGANERDYEISGHKPFLVLADYLTRQGIAVLRYDMRGTGASEGSFQSAHLEDLARDAASALRFLKGRPEIEAGKAGLVAHSMGTLLAPWVAEQFEEAAFLVILMPPSQPGHEMLVAQNARLTAASGASGAEVDSVRQATRRRFDVIRSDLDSTAAAAQVRSTLTEQGFTGEALEARVEANTMPWWRDFVRHDPRPRLEKIDVPTLAFFGSKDLFVPPEQNAEVLRAALTASPSDDAAVRVLDGLNHWLQPAETGRSDEIAQIETTIAPMLLSDLTDWIRKQVSPDE